MTEREAEYAARSAREDWYGSAGQSVKQFEQAFAEHLGLRYAAAVPHCTAALHLSMLALGLGPGDEVIVPEATWVATAAPLSYVGATPVFADIDPITWCLSADSVARCITASTKAIITVDLYGGLPDMAAIQSLATAHGIAIIEDSAQAIGASWHDRPAGTLGDVATFSFHGTKTLTTGEGGMLVTDDTALFERVARLRDHGRRAQDFKYFVTEEVGYKYRMSSLQAAFGLAQLSRIDELVAKKRQIFAWYRERLADIDGITLNVEVPSTRNAFWMSTMVVDEARGLDTREMMAAFDEQAIDTRPFFPPLSSLGAFRDVPGASSASQRNVVAYDLANRAINLPSALMLTESQVDRVCDVARSLVAQSAGVRS